MAPRFSGRRRATLVVLVLASVTLLTIDQRGSGPVDTARGFAGDVISPIRGAADTALSPFGNMWNGIFNYDDVRQENDRLRAEIDAQRAASLEAQAVVNDYNELRAVNGLTSLAAIPSVTAQVIGLPASNFELTVEIDQGSAKGLKVGMPVVSAGGLVGRLVKVYNNRSVVRLVTDPDLSVAVKIVPPQAAPGATTTTIVVPPSTTAPPLPPSTTIAPTTTTRRGAKPAVTTTAPAGAVTTTLAPTTVAPTTTTTRPNQLDRGSMHGRGQGQDLGIDFVDNDSGVKVGDVVLTSGVRSSLFPPDILCGVVSVATRNSGSLQLEVHVAPAADLGHLNFVKVLLWAPPQ